MVCTKNDLIEDHLEDWVNDTTKRLQLTSVDYVSNLHTPKKTLKDTLNLVIAEALTKVSTCL